MAEKKKVLTETTAVDTPKKTTRLNKTVLAVILWVVAMVAIGFISFTTARNNALAPNRAAESALTAIKNNDERKVYELGSSDFRKTSTQAQVKTVVNEWSPVLSKATNGKPELVSKTESTKDNKQFTSLVYKYDIQPGKSKINQKEFYIRVILEKSGSEYKVSAYNFDVKKKDSGK